MGRGGGGGVGKRDKGGVDGGGEGVIKWAEEVREEWGKGCTRGKGGVDGGGVGKELVGKAG